MIFQPFSFSSSYLFAVVLVLRRRRTRECGSPSAVVAEGVAAGGAAGEPSLACCASSSLEVWPFGSFPFFCAFCFSSPICIDCLISASLRMVCLC
jgi:hypothetical protein